MTIKHFKLADIFDYLDTIGLSINANTGGAMYEDNYKVVKLHQHPINYELTLRPTFESESSVPINILKPLFFLKTINKTEFKLNIKLFDYESNHMKPNDFE